VTDGVTVTFRDAGHILGAAEPGEYLLGEPHEVRARIARFLFRPCGRERTAALRRAITSDIRKIGLVHGEEAQALAFAEILREMKPKAEILVPEYQQTFEI
jgi:Cft2 family RNA processing exonuclease